MKVNINVAITVVLVSLYLMFVVIVTGLVGNYTVLIVVIPMGLFFAFILGVIWNVFSD